MGCVESNEALSPDLDEDEDAKHTAAPPAAAAAAEKGKRRKKTSIKSRRASGKEDSSEPENQKLRSESTKIRVIWRRYSAFSRRDSMKSAASQDEAAGPSQKPPDQPEAAPSSS